MQETRFTNRYWTGAPSQMGGRHRAKKKYWQSLVHCNKRWNKDRILKISNTWNGIFQIAHKCSNFPSATYACSCVALCIINVKFSNQLQFCNSSIIIQVKLVKLWW